MMPSNKIEILLHLESNEEREGAFSSHATKSPRANLKDLPEKGESGLTKLSYLGGFLVAYIKYYSYIYKKIFRLMSNFFKKKEKEPIYFNDEWNQPQHREKRNSTGGSRASETSDDTEGSRR